MALQGKEKEDKRNKGDGGKFEWKLSDVNIRIELIGKFKMPAGDIDFCLF